MTSLLANRSARRRGIAYMVLLAATLLMMAFSSNPGVRELQNGIGFAFRPIQGALDQVAGAAASVSKAGCGDRRPHVTSPERQRRSRYSGL